MKFECLTDYWIEIDVGFSYPMPCDKSPDRLKCGCGSPARTSSSPSESDSAMIIRDRPQEAEMDLTIKGPHPSRASQITPLFHHLASNSQPELSPNSHSMDEPLDVTLNSNKHNWETDYFYINHSIRTRNLQQRFHTGSSVRNQSRIDWDSKLDIRCFW